MTGVNLVVAFASVLLLSNVDGLPRNGQFDDVSPLPPQDVSIIPKEHESLEVSKSLPLQEDDPVLKAYRARTALLETAAGGLDGDMILTPQQKADLLERKAITNTNLYWTDKTVPFRFGDSDVSKMEAMFAIDHWREHSCLSFPEVPDTYASPHIVLTNADFCASYIGMIPTSYAPNGQEIWLHPNCVSNVGPTIHEIFHALGAFHEQARSDRDLYVEINLENIDPGKEGNFETADNNDFGVPYDFYSIMHYGPKYFSVNGMDTITPLEPMNEVLMGNRNGLSFRDKQLVNTMYGCIAQWEAEFDMVSEVNCFNGGYVGKEGKCVCPDGSSGDNCEIFTMDYVSALLADVSPLSKFIFLPSNVTSPGYPTPFQDGCNFVTVIQAPSACQRIAITFDDFDTYGRVDGECAIDGIEIQTSPSDPRQVFCGQEIAKGTKFFSLTNELVLKYFSYDYSTLSWLSSYDGFSASITFETPPDCDVSTTAATTANTTTPTTTTPETTTNPFIIVFIDGGDIPLLMSPFSGQTQSGECQIEKFVKEVAPTDEYESMYIYRYTSPGGPPNRYPAGAECHNTVYTNEPRYLRVRVEYVHIHEDDEFMINNVDGSSHKIQRWMNGAEFILPSAYHAMDFVAKSDQESYGFIVELEVMSNPCHKYVQLREDYFEQNNTLSLLADAVLDSSMTAPLVCQIWIEVPEGYQLKLEFTELNFGEEDCENDYVLFDLSGDIGYETSPSRFCGDFTAGGLPTIYSEGNFLSYILYRSNSTDVPFDGEFSIIAA